MRISTDRTSPMFYGRHGFTRPQVRLDGDHIRLDLVHEADDAEGWVTIMRRDASSSLVRVHGRPVLDTRSGRVTIMEAPTRTLHGGTVVLADLCRERLRANPRIAIAAEEGVRTARSMLAGRLAIDHDLDPHVVEAAFDILAWRA